MRAFFPCSQAQPSPIPKPLHEAGDDDDDDEGSRRLTYFFAFHFVPFSLAGGACWDPTGWRDGREGRGDRAKHAKGKNSLSTFLALNPGQAKKKRGESMR